MVNKPKFKAGDEIHVWIGEWVSATVVEPFSWTHSSGNTYVSYRVDVGTGVICCGHNSIREVIGDA